MNYEGLEIDMLNLGDADSVVLQTELEKMA